MIDSNRKSGASHCDERDRRISYDNSEEKMLRKFDSQDLIAKSCQSFPSNCETTKPNKCW
jgi:hypothetical protein